MNDILLTETAFLLEFVFTYFFACNFIGTSVKELHSRALFLLTLTLADTAITTIIPNENFSWIVSIVIMLLFLCFVFRKAFSDTVLLYCMVYVACLITQLIIALFFILIPVKLTNTVMTLLGNGLTLLVSIILYNLVSLSGVYYFIQSKNRILQAAVINLFFIFMIINLYFKNDEEHFYNFLLVFIILVSLLIFVNLEIYVNQIRYIKQSRQLQTYKDYLPIIEELIEHVRARQHDFNNQLVALQALPEIYKDYNSLVAAMAEYQMYIKGKLRDHVLLKLNLKLVAGFLFQKEHQAATAGKQLNITILNPFLQTSVPEYDVIDVLGILIDNALEATPCGKAVSLTLDSHENQIEITTRNSGPLLTPVLREKLFLKGYSTKTSSERKRGYGLHNLQSIVKHYNGNICLYNETASDNEDNIIVFEVSL